MAVGVLLVSLLLKEMTMDYLVIISLTWVEPSKGQEWLYWLHTRARFSGRTGVFRNSYDNILMRMIRTENEN